MNSKGLAPILIVVIIAAVLGGGFLVYQNQGKLQQTKVEENAPAPVVDSSSWQTVNYEMCKFSLKYPSDWKVTRKEGISCILELNEPNREQNSLVNTISIASIPKQFSYGMEKYNQMEKDKYDRLAQKGTKVETFTANIGGKDYTFNIDLTTGSFSGHFENSGQVFGVGGLLKENTPQRIEELKEIIKSIKLQ